jgi:hypothetical protein
MTDSILLGRGKEIHSVPETMWRGHLEQAPEHSRKRLAFMTEDHHRVRYFVVRELPRYGRPIPPEHISRELGLAENVLDGILDDLESNLVFLVRDDKGQVAWAFPVTAEATAHEISFSSGERLFGA